MKLVDGELEYELPYASITGRGLSLKTVDYSYDFTDYNDRLHMGRGPTKLTVSGTATSAELESLEYATGADTLYTLYYTSEQGGDNDRYYQRVDALPVQSQAITANLHTYTIELHALDGYAYDTNTGERVT